ncbi:MAG: universal stress protein [Defluviimonas sp.]|uniref:universal stress protein n=1 Tax=Albidovulum sp. TaxID=1872424 RepID=UPI001D4100CD|nr:universal stress protein [Paracoccaceae bacterium]MCC0062577.1 universal stress protein [Defluviimonas sp.]
MAFKSILTFVSGPGGAGNHLDAAIELARREDAHLDVLAVGIDHTQTGYYYAGASAILTQEAFNQAKEDAAAYETSARERLDREDIRWSVESAVAQVGAIGGPVGVLARFSDLVVMAKPYGAGSTPAAEVILEAALFEGRAPVLILPDASQPKSFGKRVVVAWNQSDEALQAIRAALPILKAAADVDITIVNPPAHGPERSDPGGRLSQLLARHGVHAEISVLAKTLPTAAEVIARHARESDADLIVMGAYGHSRFREAILGGTTRSMLEDAELPVLMAH